MFLRKTEGKFSLSEAKAAFSSLRNLCDNGTREVREALSELATIQDDQRGEPDGKILADLEAVPINHEVISGDRERYSEKI